MYLPEAVNRYTLCFIRSASAAGSSVVYDYVLDAALRDDGGGVYGARAAAAEVARRGEAAAFLSAQGLALVSDLGPAELTARYLIGSGGQPDGRIAEFVRIIHARVR